MSLRASRATGCARTWRKTSTPSDRKCSAKTIWRLCKYFKISELAFQAVEDEPEGIACDGMRKDLAEDFDAIYVLDLGGNVRKNPKLSGTTHNVFGIQVGVSINLFVRKRTDKSRKPGKPAIYYAATQTDWRREEKCRFLEDKASARDIDWEPIQRDAHSTR